MEAAWYGHFLLEVFWEGSGEASGAALNKSDKLWQNFSVNSLNEFKSESLDTKIAFSYGENDGIV